MSVVIEEYKESVVDVEVMKLEFVDQLFSNAFEMQNDNLSWTLQIIGIWIWKSIILKYLWDAKRQSVFGAATNSLMLLASKGIQIFWYVGLSPGQCDDTNIWFIIIMLAKLSKQM